MLNDISHANIWIFKMVLFAHVSVMKALNKLVIVIERKLFLLGFFYIIIVFHKKNIQHFDFSFYNQIEPSIFFPSK